MKSSTWILTSLLLLSMLVLTSFVQAESTPEQQDQTAPATLPSDADQLTAQDSEYLSSLPDYPTRLVHPGDTVTAHGYLMHPARLQAMRVMQESLRECDTALNNCEEGAWELMTRLNELEEPHVPLPCSPAKQPPMNSSETWKTRARWLGYGLTGGIVVGVLATSAILVY